MQTKFLSLGLDDYASGALVSSQSRNRKAPHYLDFQSHFCFFSHTTIQEHVGKM